MKTLPQSLILFLVWSFALFSAKPARAADQSMDAAIQAVQQAPDPSAAIAAYANGFAIDRNNPRLYDAYVSRMVDLGLPEMAYHQAQTLTTLQSNNGLAWGVVAYVDARRAQMPEAVAAINLAGQFAPDNTFVQHTAGELVAWYDLKADKTKIPENTKDGLAKVRTLLDKRPAFTEAYATAQKAYQSQASNTPQPGSAQSGAGQVPAEQVPPAAPVPNAPQAPAATQAPLAPQAQADLAPPPAYAPPPVYTAPLAPPAYPYYADYPAYPAYPAYPDYSGIYLDWGPSYCYGWGPGWVAPAPWCWWRPCGFWSGCAFFPFGVSFAFGDFDDFHRFDHHRFFDHDGRFGHDRFGHGDRFGRDGAFAHRNDPATWHHDSHGHNSFFGTPARASASTAQWARTGSAIAPASSRTSAGAGGSWWTGTGRRSSIVGANVNARPAQPATLASRSSVVANSAISYARNGNSSLAPGNWNVARPSSADWTSTSRSPTATAPVGRNWTGGSTAYSVSPTARSSWAGQSYYARNYAAAPGTTWAAQNYRAPVYAAPHYAMPGPRSSGASSGWANSAPRSFAGSYGGFHGGSSFAGGFRGGGGGSGGFHGGGGGGGFHGGGGGGFHGGGGGGGAHGGGGHR